MSAVQFLKQRNDPTKAYGFGEDVSPKLIIADAPDDTLSFTIALDDLDVPLKIHPPDHMEHSRDRCYS